MSDTRYANLEQLLEALDLAPIGHEQDDMVIRLDHGVMMRDDHLVLPHERDNRTWLEQRSQRALFAPSIPDRDSLAHIPFCAPSQLSTS